MSKALVTVGVGPHEELLQVALPSMRRFADMHGYTLLTPDPPATDRPVSWWKIPALVAALADHDEALWVDADIVIVDPTDDIVIPDGKWQALVEHRTADGRVPNCAVWKVNREMIPVLHEVWRLTHRIDHGWWEQAALLDLLGYQHDRRPAFPAVDTELRRRTAFIDKGFNFHLWDSPAPEHVRFAHATMHPDRLERMRGWAAGEPIPPRSPAPCKHRYPIRGCVCTTTDA